MFLVGVLVELKRKGLYVGLLYHEKPSIIRQLGHYAVVHVSDELDRASSPR